MELSSQDWKILQQLRERFLCGTSVQAPYWRSRRELELYHATLGQRIAWKWRAVLAELVEIGWSLPAGALVDVGCGSGIATEMVLEQFGWHHLTEIVLVDISPLALAFAAERLQERFGTLPIRRTTTVEIPPHATVVISHTLTELPLDAFERLAEQVMVAEAIIVVEPGTSHASRRVVALRERGRQQFSIVAPCPHQERCGMLQPSNARHWCHFHVSPPAEAFTERQWARFADALGIDVGDLPVSFLVLDKQWEAASRGQTRLIGAPDSSPVDVVIVTCSQEGVRQQLVRKADNPALYRLLRKHPPRWIA
ncbi:MAG: small ribosomal subunit Rsm22 family protein [Bacteroidota bacterium]|nr:small ribosomal subunit Rsm22 family protein [Candidatus Kapabacteria bacterium]MCX7937230.1 small ribosomal subunit Rsm22 family protein [Chlorobiota bacterium]MDW8075757.1 small ribosomal subunit Rsm22 family protein [Bacteroidota bacterium]